MIIIFFSKIAIAVHGAIISPNLMCCHSNTFWKINIDMSYSMTRTNNIFLLLVTASGPFYSLFIPSFATFGQFFLTF